MASQILLAALALGILAEPSFRGPALGIGVPIVALGVLGAGWLVRRRGRAIDPLDTWLPVGAVILAVLVAVRGDPFLAAFDTMVATAMVGASLAAMSGLAVTRRSGAVIVAMAAWGLGAMLLGIVSAIRLIRPTRDQLPRTPSVWIMAVGRGLIIGLPLAAIFVVLFASADPIFNDTVADVLRFRVDLGDLPGRIVFVLASGWLMGGLLSIAAWGIPALERASLGAAVRTSHLSITRSLGLPEALVILAMIDVVVGAFVLLQVAYLFGGLDTLEAAGIPYAQYARRGFFELVAATCLASTVVVVLEATIQRRTRIYVTALAALIGLTGVVLVSATYRLNLYQAAYGWTELRLYVVGAIATMAVGLLVMLGLVLADRSRWLGHALATLGLVASVSLNLIAPAAFVAARNIERVIDPSLVPPDGHSGLDFGYLAVLPDDAIPVLVDALPRLPDHEATEVRSILVTRRHQLESGHTIGSPFTWNLGRERARAALATLP